MSLVADLQDLEKFLVHHHPHEWSANAVEVFLCQLQSALLTAMAAQDLMQQIVCTTGEDAGVILKNNESPTEYSETLDCQVYLHDHFSELGDSLIELWRTAFEVEELESEESMN